MKCSKKVLLLTQSLRQVVSNAVFLSYGLESTDQLENYVLPYLGYLPRYLYMV